MSDHLCARVPKAEGQVAKGMLMQASAFDRSRRIGGEGAFVYIPITRHVDGFDTVEFVTDGIEERAKDYRDLVDIPNDMLPTSFDVVGDVAIMKVPDDIRHVSKDIGEALLKVNTKLRAVMMDSGVKGDLRVRELTRIAGIGGSETIHKEFGVRLMTDPSKVYFNPRLSMERSRIASEVKDGEVIIDMFAGVAPFGMVICKAARPNVVYSMDLNPYAEHYMRRNMELNKVSNVIPMTGDARVLMKGLPIADRIIMNLPQTADLFLDVAREGLRPNGTIHLYKILEGSQLDDFIGSLGSQGLKVRSNRALKSYSPSMAVYHFDLTLN